jgi:hypothetical protein
MESTMRTRTVVLTAGLLLAATACGNDGTGAGGGAGGPTSGPASSATGAAGGAPPQCVVGRWNASGVAAQGSAGNASATVAGGAGTTMNVAAGGATEISFSGSEPITFSAQVAGRTIRGQASYDGTVRGTVAFGAPDSTGKGTWTPERQVTWDDLRATVKLTEPISVTLLDNARLADFTGDKSTQTGGAVDVQPVLRAGNYTCAGDTLRVVTDVSGPRMEWTFIRR